MKRTISTRPGYLGGGWNLKLLDGQDAGGKAFLVPKDD